jgi:hypothetical protein
VRDRKDAKDAKKDPCKAQPPSAALFIGLGILFQGVLQQPVNGFGAGFEPLLKAEIVELLHQFRFQAEMNKLRRGFATHRQEYTRDA